MSVDNNPGILSRFKIRRQPYRRVRLIKVPQKRVMCSRVLHQYSPAPSSQSSLSLSPPPRTPSPTQPLPQPQLQEQPSTFLPRPFPPVNLAHVPVEYVRDQLRTLAPLYWNKPETADCTIVIPVPNYRGPRIHAASPDESLGSHDIGSHHDAVDPSGFGRRKTEPTIHSVPHMVLKLHVDYLSAQSTFLRGLFSGSSPIGLINASPAPSSSCSNHSPFDVPPSRLPRLLPSPPSHPAIFLPIPDPTSIHCLFHWMYFGDTTPLAHALARGVVHWEGVARNVEYLGMGADIKVFLGRWYREWVWRSDSEKTEGWDWDSDDEDADESDEGESEEDDDDSVTDVERGRTRTVRPLIKTLNTPDMAASAASLLSPPPSPYTRQP